MSVVSREPDVQPQVTNQLHHHVLGGVCFYELHNDVRYHISVQFRATPVTQHSGAARRPRSASRAACSPRKGTISDAVGPTTQALGQAGGRIAQSSWASSFLVTRSPSPHETTWTEANPRRAMSAST